MTKNARPRHSAPGRASKIAGRAALGLLGAPVAMFAAAGPASAADIDLAGSVTDDAIDAQVATDDGVVPGALGLGGLGTDDLSTDALPIDGAVFEGVPLDLLGGVAGDTGLPVPSTDALPGLSGGLPVEAGLTDEGGLYAAAHIDLPGAPAVDDEATDEGDATGEDADSDEAVSDEADDADSDEADSNEADSDEADSDEADEADSDDADDVAPAPAADLFSATDLVSGLL